MVTQGVANMSELPISQTQKNRTATGLKVNINAADAVRLVVNTAVEMSSREPAIDIMSVTEGKRGPGILIWIPGYVHNGDTIVEAEVVALEGEP